MSDILERLRDFAEFLISEDVPNRAEDIVSAAAEIAKLRSQLEKAKADQRTAFIAG